MTLWIVAAAGAGFASGLLAALVFLRRRPAMGQSPELPVHALEALVREAPLIGAQAACVVDRLRKLRPGELDRIELTVYLLTLEAQVLKTGHLLAIDFHRLQKHLLRAHPQTVFPIFLAVDDEFLLGFDV
jgi:hypothetical protein